MPCRECLAEDALQARIIEQVLQRALNCCCCRRSCWQKRSCCSSQLVLAVQQNVWD